MKPNIRAAAQLYGSNHALWQRTKHGLPAWAWWVVGVATVVGSLAAVWIYLAVGSLLAAGVFAGIALLLDVAVFNFVDLDIQASRKE